MCERVHDITDILVNQTVGKERPFNFHDISEMFPSYLTLITVFHCTIVEIKCNFTFFSSDKGKERVVWIFMISFVRCP